MKEIEAKQIAAMMNIDLNEFESLPMSEQIFFRKRCCINETKDGYGDIRSLENVLDAIDIKVLLMEVQLSYLMSEEQKKESFNLAYQYCDTLRWLLSRLKTVHYLNLIHINKS